MAVVNHGFQDVLCHNISLLRFSQQPP